MKVRTAGTACVPAQRNLFASLYRKEVLVGVEVYLITFLRILLFGDVSGNFFRKAVEVRIDTGMSGGGMIDIEGQPVAAGGDADAGYVPLFDGSDRLADSLLRFKVDSRMKVIASEFTEVPAESGRNG